jgi:hypothetical protein
MIFRRCIVVTSRYQGPGGEVRAAVEDDFHHFRVRLAHDGERVQSVQGSALRHPYSTCPLAAQPLAHLEGMILDPIAHSVVREVDPRQQCTHMLDLAGLSMATAARRVTSCRYDIAVPRRVQGRTHATLSVDGTALLAWDIQDTTILGPAPFSSISLREGMASWALSALDAQTAEAALVLRRCALISLGRTKNLDAQVHAEPTGRCFAQQPQRASAGARMVGSMLDFTDMPEALCRADAAWLAFHADAA